MKIFTSLITALLLFGASMPAARADATVDIDYFYDALSPYGDWVEVEGYGYCFQPVVTVEDPEWRPYTDGQWAYTDAGWAWVSNEDFGWATYHYGRWLRAGAVWLWIPGDEWAPAWVSWRSSPEYVGWAPLPPEAVWQPDVGFSVGVDTTYDIGPSYYCFVAIRHFGAPRLRTYVEPWRRNVDYMRWTNNCTHITYRQSDVRERNIFIGGPDYIEVNRYSERPFRRMSLRRDDSFDPRGDRSRRSREEGDSLIVTAPRVSIGERKALPADRVKTRLDKSVVDRGWKGIKADEAGNVREKLKREVVEAKTRPGRGGPPDADRDRGPGSTVAPGTSGERPPKALPATPGEVSKTLPGADTPGRGDRTPGPGMRRPGDDTPDVPKALPGKPGPGRVGEDDAKRDRDGRGPDSSNRVRVPDATDRPSVGPGPGTAPEMKPKDEDGRGRPDAKRSDRDGESSRAKPGNTVSPVVPRPGGVPPENERKEKVMPPTERTEKETPSTERKEKAMPPTERKQDLTPREGPDRRGRPVRPDTNTNENAIPKPGKSERKMDRTPDAPPAPRNVAPPVAPTPRPEARKVEPPKEESRRRSEANEAPRPQKIERPEAPRPQKIERPQAPPPAAPAPAPAAGGGGGANKEKSNKKDEEEKEKGKRGR
ncbi:MAG TPA: DUF6600 domain-containing protein [Candidatus Saccharimonadia bacterium]|nr:DUF6600 domain-containing protein [Candidatus Saccharimonadia bacterium]